MTDTTNRIAVLRQAAEAGRTAAAWLDAEADIQDSVPQVATAVADLVATVQQQGMDVTVAASTLDYAHTLAAAYLGGEQP